MQKGIKYVVQKDFKDGMCIVKVDCCHQKIVMTIMSLKRKFSEYWIPPQKNDDNQMEDQFW